MIQKYIKYVYKRDISSRSAIPLHQLKLYKLHMLNYHFLFSQKGANMSKQLFYRYNIGSIMSVIFKERLRGHAGYPFETLHKHSYSPSLTKIQTPVRCITCYAIKITIFTYNVIK